jgi:GH24 family phage-related lysozyme (muramidase)
MRESEWVFDAIRDCTRFRPTAWRAHRNDPWTIGYGHTGRLSPLSGEVMAGATISQRDAELLLHCDIETAVVQVDREHPNVPQVRFDVMVALRVAGQC